MKWEIVEAKTKDGLTLPGLLSRPQKSKTVVIHLHGTGDSSSLYGKRRYEAFAHEFAKKGISFAAMNNRGALFIKDYTVKKGKKSQHISYGSAYEKIIDCIQDIDAFIALFRKMGFIKFILAGHSTGANKAVLYHYKKPKNLITGIILLAPCDDTGLYYAGLGKNKFWKTFQFAKQMVKKGKGSELMPGRFLDYALLSWQAIEDTLDPDGNYNIFPYREVFKSFRLGKKELFREWKSITKPTLVIFGNNDEYCFGDVPQCMKVLENYSHPQIFLTTAIVTNSGHSFRPKEKVVGKIMSDWISKTL